jgi:hypothetical protein
MAAFAAHQFDDPACLFPLRHGRTLVVALSSRNTGYSSRTAPWAGHFAISGTRHAASLRFLLLFLERFGFEGLVTLFDLFV